MLKNNNIFIGYSSELPHNQESAMSTAKRLRERLQRQTSGQSGRRYTGESSESASLIGTPTANESGRSFTFTAPPQRLSRSEDRKSSYSNQNMPELLLEASDSTWGPALWVGNPSFIVGTRNLRS